MHKILHITTSKYISYSYRISVGILLYEELIKFLPSGLQLPVWTPISSFEKKKAEELIQQLLERKIRLYVSVKNGNWIALDFSTSNLLREEFDIIEVI